MHWLLDHNLPAQLKAVLISLGINCETAQDRGWEKLQNGDLVRASSLAGFSCILTRDVRFEQAARFSLKSYSKMSIVLIRLPQRRSKIYLAAFSSAWKLKPIVPVSGKVVVWP